MKTERDNMNNVIPFSLFNQFIPIKILYEFNNCVYLFKYGGNF